MDALRWERQKIDERLGEGGKWRQAFYAGPVAQQSGATYTHVVSECNNERSWSSLPPKEFSEVRDAVRRIALSHVESLLNPEPTHGQSSDAAVAHRALTLTRHCGEAFEGLTLVYRRYGIQRCEPHPFRKEQGFRTEIEYQYSTVKDIMRDHGRLLLRWLKIVATDEAVAKHGNLMGLAETVSTALKAYADWPSEARLGARDVYRGWSEFDSHWLEHFRALLDVATALPVEVRPGAWAERFAGSLFWSEGSLRSVCFDYPNSLVYPLALSSHVEKARGMLEIDLDDEEAPGEQWGDESLDAENPLSLDNDFFTALSGVPMHQLLMTCPGLHEMLRETLQCRQWYLARYGTRCRGHGVKLPLYRGWTRLFRCIHHQVAVDRAMLKHLCRKSTSGMHLLCYDVICLVAVFIYGSGFASNSPRDFFRKSFSSTGVVR